MKYEDIKDFSQRCEEHEDHQTGMISTGMLVCRMQEEIDELREYIEQRKPLTDEQIDSIVAMSCKKDSSHLDAARVARAIEAAHNIKE